MTDLRLMTRFRCGWEDYLQAKRVLAELGYPTGCNKWEAFWAGFRAWARGDGRDSCPIPDVTDEQRAEGRRTPHTRTAWLNGFAAALWTWEDA